MFFCFTLPLVESLKRGPRVWMLRAKNPLSQVEAIFHQRDSLFIANLKLDRKCQVGYTAQRVGILIAQDPLPCINNLQVQLFRLHPASLVPVF